jgi:drug/metabolite transporter (DMT)-like permease
MVVLGESFERNTFIGAAFVLVGVVAANGKYIYRRMVEVVE